MAITAAEGSNCIDCHKGIAHYRPNMNSGFRDRYRQLQRQGSTSTDAIMLFSLGEKSLAATAESPVGEALLSPATEVKVLKEEGCNVQLEITGWCGSRGHGRVITQYMGKRVFSAVLGEPLMASVRVLQTQVDPDSRQRWQQVSVTAWTTDQDSINTLAPTWGYSDQMLQPTYSAYHSIPPTTRYAINDQTAGLKAISTYYQLNPVKEHTLLKCLQTHASDVSETNKR